MEVTDLASGVVRAIVHPVTVSWQNTLNRKGQGSMTFSTRAVKIRDIWPGLAGVYISRVADGNASEANPICEFAGYVDQVQAGDDNTTQVGIQSIDEYLWHRTIKDTIRWDNTSQTVIGKELVDLAAFNGIPLFSVAADSGTLRDREYKDWNLKIIGEAVEQLTGVINGPDWELGHTRTEGHWSSTMTFRDRVGADRGVILRSDQELSAYSITIDAADMATRVDALGEGEEEDQLRSTVVDPAGIYPEFDASPAWVDVSIPATLAQHAQGYLETNREPDARPTVTISGLDPDPSQLRLGDVVQIHTDYGPVTYHGAARVISISWGLDVDAPETRTLEVTPLLRASEAVLTQVPADPTCRTC